jgi:uncharacterized protein (TIGR03437 family)
MMIRFPVRFLLLATLPFLASAQNINLVAGSGAPGYNGDNIQAKSAQLFNPRDVALDKDGNLYIADMYNHRVRKVDPQGVITTVAGTGNLGYGGDGGSALAADFNYTRGVVVDKDGNLYIADMYNHRVRKVSKGIVSTVAGTGTAGYNGDNLSAANAQLSLPACVAVDSNGALYIAEEDGNRIRKVDTKGIITTVAGTGAAGYNGDGIKATGAQLSAPDGVALDSAGNLFIADSSNNRIRKVTVDGMIATVAGTGAAGSGGDGGAATSARLSRPRAVLVDSAGNFYIGDTLGNGIRKVSTAGVISTVTGDGTPGYSGDGGAAAAARVSGPRGMAMDAAGTLYFADADNHRIRAIALGPPAEDPRPQPTAVVNGASFQTGIAASAWITILGAKLSPTTRVWTAADIANGKLPTALDGVRVNVNKKPAFVYFISPQQLNVLAPADDTTGAVPIEVITPQGTSLAVTAQKANYSPAFFMYSGTTVVIGVAGDGTLIAKAGFLPGVITRPAAPGEVIMLFGTGFGLTNPALPPDSVVTQPALLAGKVTIRIGGIQVPDADISYAGQVGSGLCQFNLKVPASLPDGEHAIVAEVGGFTSLATGVLAVKK